MAMRRPETRICALLPKTRPDDSAPRGWRRLVALDEQRSAADKRPGDHRRPGIGAVGKLDRDVITRRIQLVRLVHRPLEGGEGRARGKATIAVIAAGRDEIGAVRRKLRPHARDTRREGDAPRRRIGHHGIVEGRAIGAHLDMEGVAAGKPHLRPAGPARLEQQRCGVADAGLVDLDLVPRPLIVTKERGGGGDGKPVGRIGRGIDAEPIDAGDSEGGRCPVTGLEGEQAVFSSSTEASQPSRGA